MHIREGSQQERESFFMMGFDAWGGGKSEEEFLEALRPVQRYDLGTWYVLQGEDGPVAALILYRSGLNLPAGCWGVGSVATWPEHRRRGYAAVLMQHVVALGEEEDARGIYLFSGVSPDYYRQFGFEFVSAAQPEDQDPCMVLAYQDVEELSNAVPDFF